MVRAGVACGDAAGAGVARRLGGARAERMLFERAARGDQRARGELVERYLPLARSIALRYRRSHDSLDDLLQVASVGLVKAIDRFDPARGLAFSSFAVPTIAGELKRYFRDFTWAVRPPRDLQERTLRVDSVADALARELGRTPTIAELAKAAGMNEEQLLEVIQARSARGALSLSAPAGPDGEGTLADRLGSDDGGIRSAETQAMLAKLLAVLSPRERDVLRLRFDEDLTQAEIGAAIGVSQMQVSRIIRQALQRLRCVAEPPRPAADEPLEAAAAS